METKDQPLRQPPADKEMGGVEKKNDVSLLKAKVNNFLIDYFGYLAMAVAVIIFVAGLFFFAYPRYQEMIKNNEMAEKSLQTNYEEKSAYLSAIRDLKNAYQSIDAASRKKIHAMVPVGDKTIDIIPEIELIVARNGVTLNSIKIEDLSLPAKSKTEVASGQNNKMPAGIFEQLPSGVGLARIELSLSSVNYPVLKNLLKTLENNLRLFDVSKTNYNVEEKTADLTIYAYYFLNSTIPPQAESAPDMMLPGTVDGGAGQVIQEE